MIWSIDLFSGAGSGNVPDGGGAGGNPGSGGGQNGGGAGAGGAVVYIDPQIWTEPNPQINCIPPCTFILPPLVLPTPTTISFPPYVTSLDVAWSAATGWTHIVETTTLTIPPVTLTAIDVWEFTVTNTDTATTVITTFYPTSSILPPPFIIYNNPNPLSQSGVVHPVVSRTITPPPFPYAPPVHTATTTTGPGPVGLILPVVTFKPGPPGPICLIGCGLPCVLFCSHPCLLDCPDGGNDFNDPKDPNPPGKPTANPTNDPLPTGSPTVIPVPIDQNGVDPEDENEDEEDEQCAFAFGQAVPNYIDPNFGGSGTQTVSPAAPTPTPHPPPEPVPPTPNPSTEKLHCNNAGAMTSRASMIDAINQFCTANSGWLLWDDGFANVATASLTHYGGGVCVETMCSVDIYISITAINGCRFNIDGPGTNQECGRIFREAVDKCDTDSTKYKQGGTVTSNCAIYNIDPNQNFGV
jgi:hypothetical protein